MSVNQLSFLRMNTAIVVAIIGLIGVILQAYREEIIALFRPLFRPPIRNSGKIEATNIPSKIQIKYAITGKNNYDTGLIDSKVFKIKENESYEDGFVDRTYEIPRDSSFYLEIWINDKKAKN